MEFLLFLGLSIFGVFFPHNDQIDPCGTIFSLPCGFSGHSRFVSPSQAVNTPLAASVLLHQVYGPWRYFNFSLDFLDTLENSIIQPQNFLHLDHIAAYI